MKKMYAIASKQANDAKPLDWKYNATPAKWLIDGEEYEFNWFDETGAEFIAKI